jgi:hypothetical protein
MRRRALLVLAALAVAACGKTGPPVPPETRVPGSVVDLSGFVRPDAIELHWTNPRRRVDGSPLRDLTAAHVYRSEDDGTGEPRSAMLHRGRVPGYTEVARIDLAHPERGTSGPTARRTVVDNGRVTFPDSRGLVFGRRYTYVVLTEDSIGRLSAPSSRVSIVYVAAPEPPFNLAATPVEHEVRLEWQAPARLLDGSPVTGTLLYEVLRAPSPEAEPVLVTREPIAERRFVDRDLENDRTYLYRVRAVRREGDTLVRGEPSASVAATPRDMTPPSAPRDLVAVPAGREARLAWSPSPDPDVAAYVIYRATPGGAFERVGSVRAPLTTFVDRDLDPGTYRYAVTALDSGVQPNESARSPEAVVTLP